MTTSRYYFLDNIRVVAIILVIAQHVGQAYGPTGGYWPIQEATRSAVLEPFFTVNRSFGMSLFFMIAGYFAALACERKGPRAFVKGRLLRLGLPLLGFMLCMIPVQLLISAQSPEGPSAWPIEAGHMWFVEHLIVYCAGYAAWRAARNRRGETGIRPTNPPRTLSILGFALALAVVSAVVREWFPIDHWDYLLGFFRVAFADVPRDLSFFVIGTLIYRHDWLFRFPTKSGYRWLAAGLALAALRYAYDLGIERVAPLDDTLYDVLYPIWESVLCCAMCIGLTVLFREKGNVHDRIMRAAAQSQYAAYIFHVWFVMALQYAMAGVDMGPFFKFMVVLAASVPLVFAFGYWVRKPLHI